MNTRSLLFCALVALGAPALTGCSDPAKFFFPWLEAFEDDDDGGPEADATQSTVTVDRATGVLADDEDVATITVTVRDKKGKPLKGKPVEITASGDGHTITGPTARTTDAGVATATIRSRLPGTKTISATVPGDAKLAQKPTVEFERPTGFARAAQAGSVGDEEALGIAALPDGGTVVVGRFTGTADFGGGHTITATGTSSDIFVARYDWAGACVYAKSAGGAGEDSARAVAALPDGSVVVTGFYEGPPTATFGKGESRQKILSGAGRQIFVARFAANGSLLWALGAGGSGSDEGRDVAAAPDGRTTVTGIFQQGAVFGSGKSVFSAGGDDAFVARYHPDGDIEWVVSAGGAGDEIGVAVAAYADGSAAVGGAFAQGFTLGGRALQTEGQQDIWIARYDEDGSVVDAQSAGGPGTDAIGDLAGLPDGAAVIVGTFDEEATFGEGAGAKTITSTSLTEIFVAAYEEGGDLLWATPGEGSDTFQALSVAALADGSVVVAGGFAGTAELGPGGTLDATGAADAFIAHWDEAGDFLWARRVDGTGEDRARGVAATGDGGFAVVGRFEGVAVFGDGEANEEALGTGGAGDFDVFWAKYYPYVP